MTSWYRKFIPDYATIAAPLTKLLQKKQKWIWVNDQQTAFQELKNRLTEAPVLSCPNFSVPFELQTDASNTGLGAVLTQTIDNVEHVISYASRSLLPAERNYSTTEKECLAVIWAIGKYRAYLEGYRFTVITDHSSLRWLHNLKNPTGRLARWSLSLLEYDFSIIHRKGANHHVPDALSRIFEDQNSEYLEPDKETLLLIENNNQSWYVRRFLAVKEFPKKFPNWKIENDRLYRYHPDPKTSIFVPDLDGWKIVPTDIERQDLIVETHVDPQSGHLGVEKTHMRLSQHYYWPGSFKDVHDFVKSCETCQMCKVEQKLPPGLLGQRIVEEP